MVAVVQKAQFLLEGGPVEKLVDADAAAGRLGGVGWADALAGGADVGGAQLHFLEAVDELVQIEDEVGAVRDEDAAGRVKALFLHGLELGEEGRHVHDGASANQVQAPGIDQSWTGQCLLREYMGGRGGDLKGGCGSRS